MWVSGRHHQAIGNAAPNPCWVCNALEREEAASRKFDSLSCIVVCRWLWSHVGADGFDRGLGAIVLLKWPSRHSGNKSLGPCHDMMVPTICFVLGHPVSLPRSLSLLRRAVMALQLRVCAVQGRKDGRASLYGDWPKWWNSSKGARVNVKLLFYQAANAVWNKEDWSR